MNNRNLLKNINKFATYTNLRSGCKFTTKLNTKKNNYNAKIISNTNTNRSIFTIVPQSYEVYRLYLGKNPVKLEPGIHWNLPLFHQTLVVDMKESSIFIDKLNAFTKDNVSVSISGSLFYRVTNSYDACFKIQDYKQNIENLGTSAMRSVIGLFQYDEIIADRKQINVKLSEMIGETSENWGIKCTNFEIQSFVPANRDVEHQLEKQLEAERNRRKQVLDTEANINVAEGEKRRIILKSEGDLVAAKNESDALYVKLQKEAEGKKYLIEQETIAMKIQLETLINILGSSELAIKFLIEQQKLQHLQTMASGPNNNTYFVPDGNKLLPNMKIFNDM